MKAAIWTNINKIEVRDVPIPIITDNEVLIKVSIAGICVSDYNMFCGNFERSSFPHILGHEICGIISKVGKNINYLTEGTRCVISTMIGCGHCENCRRGYQYLCKDAGEIGFAPYNGGYAEYVKVPASCVVLIPDNISDEEGGILESIVCPFESLLRVGVPIGGSVLVQGAGFSGLVAIMLCKSLGSTQIIATARRNDRIDLAKKYGSTQTINTSEIPDVVAKVMELTNGNGVDLAIDAVGVPNITESTIFSVKRGGDVLLYGLPKKGNVPPLPSIHMINNGISIHGGAGNTNTWQQTIQFVSKKRIDIKKLITNRFTIDDISKAFELYAINDKNNIKSIIVF